MNSTCKHVAGVRFCPHCGKQLVVAPIDGRFMLEQYSIWTTKLLRDTIIGLTLRPGHLIRDYLTRDRDLILKPITYVALCVGVFLYVNDTLPADACDRRFWLCALALKNALTMQLVQAAITSIVVKYVFYRSAPYSFYEILAFALYILAQSLLISSLMLLAQDAGAPPLVALRVGFAIRELYALMALGQFFEAKSVLGWLKAALALAVSMALLVALIVALQVEHDVYAGAGLWGTP